MLSEVQLHLSLLFHIKDYVSYKKKLPSFQLFSANFNAVVPFFRFFLITKLKKMWNISFLHDFQIMVFYWKMISNERPFEWYIIWLCSEKTFSPTCQLWHHNILYLTRYLVLRIHCEIFLSRHFRKYSFRVISWNMK